MSFGPLLLRVMLILTFVLNGTTSAMAAAQMSLGHPMPQGEAMQPAAAPVQHQHDMSACHHDGMASDATASTAHGHASHSVPTKHHGHSSDCCEGGTCQCVCAHGMHAAVPSPVLAMHAYGRKDQSEARTAGHAAPDLPHLIRPPIS
jgi:hypothetical protein